MQVTIDENSGTGSVGGVEKFEEVKLDTGEVARFIIPVPAATAEYVHELKPVSIVNGVIQMETKTKKDKSTYEVWATGFNGRKICTGVVDIPNPDDPEHPLPGPMRIRGVDPENCIMCAAAAEGIASLKAELRYAIPIIRITTRSKTSTDIQEPPSAKILVLPLTWRQYNDLATNLKGIRELYGWGPEIKVRGDMADIVIKCEDAGFKRYQWLTPMRPHWKKESENSEVRNPALRAAIFGLWKNPDNRPTPEQLQASCGKVSDPVFLQQDLNEVVESHAQAKRIESGETAQPPAATAQAGGAQDLGDGLDGLDDIDKIIGESSAASAASPADTDSLVGLEEFGVETTSNPSAPANGNGAQPASPPASSAPAEELFDGAGETAEPVPAAAAAPAGEAESFDQVWDKL